MIRAVKEFLRECVRLLYWVFFKPTALRAHINRIAPGYEERLLKAERTTRARAAVNLRELRETPKLRQFALKALFVTICAPTVLYLSIGLTITALGGGFNWQKSWDDLAFGVVVGVAYGVLFGTRFSLTASVSVSVATGVAAGVAFGVLFSVSFGVTAGVTVGIAGSIATSVAFSTAFGIAFGIAAGVALGVAAGVAAGVATGISFGILVGVATSVAAGVAATRLPIYLFELFPTVSGYRRSLHNKQFGQALSRSPIHFDEPIFFPQPFLSSLLFYLLRQDLDAGLKYTAFVTTHPNQNWAAQKALRRLIAQDQISFFFVLDQILTSPTPYEPLVFSPRNLRRASFRYYSALSILAEIADNPQGSGPIYKQMRKLTFRLGLRTREESLHAPSAAVYQHLLYTYWQVGRDLFDGEDANADATVEKYRLADAVSQFERT